VNKKKHKNLFRFELIDQIKISKIGSMYTVTNPVGKIGKKKQSEEMCFC